MAEVIDRFTEVVGLDRFAIYVFDYGAPTGFRIAVKHPDRITAIISQNGNAYEEGLSEGWNPIRAYWEEPRRPIARRCAHSCRPRRPIGNTPMASRIRAAVSPDGYRSTISTSRGRALTRCSSICSAITRAMSRCTRRSRIISGPTSRRCSRSGARTIRSFCRRAPRRSSATFRVRTSASSIPGISRWRRSG